MERAAAGQRREPQAGLAAVQEHAHRAALAAGGKGGTVSVLLHSGESSLWLPPLASSSALQPTPNGEASLVEGATGAWYTAVRPGQVLVTSVRPPCQAATAAGKGGLEPADPVPKSYLLRVCAPGQRFSVSIVVAS
ncbi:hypothetical protein B4Q13_14855 [Lacticaseibacillus rhamnosus]